MKKSQIIFGQYSPLMAVMRKRVSRDKIDPLVGLGYAEQDSELILIDVPSCKGWGYSTDTLKGRKN